MQLVPDALRRMAEHWILDLGETADSDRKLRRFFRIAAQQLKALSPSASGEAITHFLHRQVGLACEQ